MHSLNQTLTYCGWPLAKPHQKEKKEKRKKMNRRQVILIYFSENRLGLLNMLTFFCLHSLDDSLPTYPSYDSRIIQNKLKLIDNSAVDAEITKT